MAKADVGIAKNYLSEQEIDELNRIVVMWLDFAEDQARRRQQVFLRDWETKLDEFLRFNDREVLNNAGTISQRAALDHANAVYDTFSAQRRALVEAEAERHLEAELRAAVPTPAAPTIAKKKKKSRGANT